MIRRTLAAIAVVVAAWTPVSVAQTVDPGALFRVFLTNGQALASYGESALAGDRVVFTLLIGDGGTTSDYQLVSLPAAAVDLERTTRYSYAIRAARYAATQGEADYAVMTAEVLRAIDEITQVEDPKTRLGMAVEAKRRLLAWSQDNFGYRADDIQELGQLFDDVIAELRTANGESSVSVNLYAGPAAPKLEPLLPAPSLRQSIELALAAADAADPGTDRTVILRAVSAVAAAAPDVAALAAEASRRLLDEQSTDRAYALLSSNLAQRAEVAVKRGDVRTIEALQAELGARDRSLGSRRPEQVTPLRDLLATKLEESRVRRLALEHYALMRPLMVAYEQSVRPIFAVLDGATPSLEAIQHMDGPGIYWLQRVEANLRRVEPGLKALTAPADLADVHSTILSALWMALEACTRRRLAMATLDMAVARQASSAAAGAQLLTGQARKDLLARLYPRSQ